MKDALLKIIELKNLEIIRNYAIGGAFASIFYIEPISTYDLDIMIMLKSEKNSLNPLENVFRWAKENKFELNYEHIMIFGVPVQFLPVYNDLVTEAVHNCIIKNYEDVEVNVISPEYLVAIMFDTFRAKDKERIARFYENFNLDKNKLNDILTKFNLVEKYNQLFND